jgi:mono/diheme cytochrome c family protein
MKFVFAISALSALLAACVATQRPPQSDPRVARGEAVAAQWCADCHAVAARTRDAPSFREIAQRPGRDRDYLAAFMREDHFPMTTFRLFEEEKNDVAAFILSLAER